MKTKFTHLIFSVVLAMSILHSVYAKNNPLQTVEYVDLHKYMGKWYEIALFPQWYEKNCTGTTADYTLMPNGKVKVINSCHLHTLDGKLKVAKGSAYVVDKKTNAKLKVTFFWPFYGDYWILDLGPNYEYVMVGTPDRKALWFLSRKPKLNKEIMEHLKKKATSLGFDISKLIITLQPSSE